MLMRRLLFRLHDDRGLTLVELTVSMMLLALILAPALAFLASTQRSEKIADQATQQQQDARIAVSELARDLRGAGYAEGHSYQDSQIFLAASSMDVTFYSDVNNDGIDEKVRYYLDTATARLIRVVTIPDCTVSPCDYSSSNAVTTTTPEVSNVRNNDLTACAGQSGSQPMFSFFKKDPGTGGATPMPSPSPAFTNVNDLVDIYYVSIVVVDDVTPGKSPTCQTLSTTVQLRNWRG